MKVTQYDSTLHDPVDYTVHEILQARILEWVDFPFFRGTENQLNASKLLLKGASLIMKVKVKSLTHVGLFATPWTVAYQAPLSMEFSRQECWSG